MEFVQVRIKTEEGAFGGYYNYEFAIVLERGTTSSEFDLPRNERYDDNRIQYSIKNSEFKVILKDKS